MACEMKFDVVILDLMLPKINGFSVCQQLRERGCQLPVLMLTAADNDEEQIEGFDSGIDDFVVKPCPMPVLWARLNALTRRNHAKVDKLSVGDLTVYLNEHRAHRAGIDIKLTPTGWKILVLLMQNSPNVVSRSDIEDHVWPDGEADAGNFNVQLHQLRKALDKPFATPLIHTLVGVGLVLRDVSRERT
jgi:DNA-binding response OmpR family regulator